MNRPGLIRNGFDEETISWLKEAQRLLFHEGVGREEAVERLSQQGEFPPLGRELFEFLRRQAEGKQGRALQP